PLARVSATDARTGWGNPPLCRRGFQGGDGYQSTLTQKRVRAVSPESRSPTLHSTTGATPLLAMAPALGAQLLPSTESTQALSVFSSVVNGVTSSVMVTL